MVEIRSFARPPHPVLATSARSLIAGGWQLIQRGDGSREVYEVEADARQERNLAEAEPERTARLAQTLADLERLISSGVTAEYVNDPELVEQLRSLGYVR